MKKILSLLLVIMLLVTTLTSCDFIEDVFDIDGLGLDNIFGGGNRKDEPDNDEKDDEFHSFGPIYNTTETAPVDDYTDHEQPTDDVRNPDDSEVKPDEYDTDEYDSESFDYVPSE